MNADVSASIRCGINRLTFGTHDPLGALSARLGFALTVASALALAWAITKAIGRVWARSIGARQHQRRILNSLFPGANIRYVEGLLGYPTLVSRDDDTQRVLRHRLLDCWLSVGVSKDSVDWMSVTVTDAKFAFRTDRFTQGLVDVKLGRANFEAISKLGWFVPQRVDPPGQKEQKYVESCDGPTAVRSQKMIVGYTNLGVGDLATYGELSAPTLDRARTVVNSLAIAKPFCDLPADVFLGWQEAQVVPLGRNRRPVRRLWVR